MTKETSTLFDRRALLTSCAAGASAVALGGFVAATPAYAAKGGSDLPPGHRRGRIIDRSEGTPVYEVLDSRGSVVGVTLTESQLKNLRTVSQDMEAEYASAPPVGMAGAQSVAGVAACAGAIAWFVAQTVFPAARIANLAFRLGRLVAKYGARTVARIFRGARGIAGRTAEKEIIDLAKSLSGVAALAACGI